MGRERSLLDKVGARFSKRVARPPEPQYEPVVISSDDREILVTVRSHPRASRMTLRINPRADGAKLTVPKGTSKKRINRFVADHADWITECVLALPPRATFEDGNSFEVMGQKLTIRHMPTHRGKCAIVGTDLIVGGDPPHISRRIQDFLKEHLRDEISRIVRVLTVSQDLKAGRITIRDQASRWGSCAANGNLSFNWRLIFAPRNVLEYVVAHEVAHLRHMDHSPSFWRLVGKLDPHWRTARGWLDENGAGLHRIG